MIESIWAAHQISHTCNSVWATVGWFKNESVLYRCIEPGWFMRVFLFLWNTWNDAVSLKTLREASNRLPSSNYSQACSILLFVSFFWLPSHSSLIHSYHHFFTHPFYSFSSLSSSSYFFFFFCSNHFFTLIFAAHCPT